MGICVTPPRLRDQPDIRVRKNVRAGGGRGSGVMRNVDSQELHGCRVLELTATWEIEPIVTVMEEGECVGRSTPH